MLSTREQIAARQGKYGTPRHEYLQQLVSEYQRSPHWLRREEIIANLANFAYDPINYAALHQLGIMGLFVDILSMNEGLDVAQQPEVGVSVNVPERNGHYHGASPVSRSRPPPPPPSAQELKSRTLLVEFALGGICNCIADPILQRSFIENGGVPHILTRIAAIAASSDEFDRSDPMAVSRHRARLSALGIGYFLLDSPAFEEVTSDAMLDTVRALSAHSDPQIANIAHAFRTRYEELLASVP